MLFYFIFHNHNMLCDSRNALQDAYWPASEWTEQCDKSRESLKLCRCKLLATIWNFYSMCQSTRAGCTDRGKSGLDLHWNLWEASPSTGRPATSTFAQKDSVDNVVSEGIFRSECMSFANQHHSLMTRHVNYRFLPTHTNALPSLPDLTMQ